MVLNILSLFLLVVFGSGCMTTGGYERYGIYNERHDRIYEHRASFIDDSRISMAYAIVYWDVLQSKEGEEEGRIPEVFYIWLRNNTTVPVMIDPNNLSLITEKGDTFPLSPRTETTPTPLREQKIGPEDTAAGYVVFEIPSAVIESERPSRLVYNDKAGTPSVRYLQIEDMKKYEGLILEKQIYYYSPVYPRHYWYPYYYPFDYYPYDLQFFFFYSSAPYHRHYYYIPVEPKRREFYVPPAPQNRGFKERGSTGSKGFFGRLFDTLWSSGSTSSPNAAKEKQQNPVGTKDRQFP